MIDCVVLSLGEILSYLDYMLYHLWGLHVKPYIYIQAMEISTLLPAICVFVKVLCRIVDWLF